MGRARTILGTVIFVVHASASVFLLYVNFDTERYGTPNDVHYIEKFIHSFAKSRSLHRSTHRSGVLGGPPVAQPAVAVSVPGAWPVIINDPGLRERGFIPAVADAPARQGGAAQGIPDPGGLVLVPNLPRCMARGIHAATRPPGDAWVTHTNRLQACALTGQLQRVKVEVDPWYTMVIGSWVNISYLMLLFEWISASFALFYIAVPTSGSGGSNILRLVVLGVSTSWNLTLLALSVLLSGAGEWNLPTNNLVVGVSVLVGAITTQVLRSWDVVQHYTQWVPGGRDPSSSTKRVTWGEACDRIGGKGQAEGMRRRLSPSRLYGFGPGDSTYLSGAAGVSYPAGWGQPEGERVFGGVVWWDQGAEEGALDDASGEAEVMPEDIVWWATSTRYLEYAITAPLLMLGVQSTTAIGTPLWALQSSYMLMAATNLYGVPIHIAAEGLYAACQGGRGVGCDQVDPLRWACILFLSSSWVLFSGCWLVYADLVTLLWSSVPSDVRYVFVILPAGFSLFGVGATVFYVWLLVSCDQGVRPSARCVQRSMGMLNTYFDVLSLSVKVSIAAVIVFSDQFGPGSGRI